MKRDKLPPNELNLFKPTKTLFALYVKGDAMSCFNVITVFLRSACTMHSCCLGVIQKLLFHMGVLWLLFHFCCFIVV